MLKSFVFGLAMVAVSAVAAFAGNIEKEIIGPSVQLDRFCSATAIYSERDKNSGKVATYFLTAKHCIKGKEGVILDTIAPVYDDQARLVKEEHYKVRVKGSSYKTDVALLEAIDTSNIFPAVATVAAKDVKVKRLDPVVLSGYPAGLSLTITEGKFVARESIPFPEDGKDTEYFRATPATIGGNSGGGLYLEIDGKWQIIGIATAALKNAPHMAFFTPVNDIREYIDVAITPVKTSTPLTAK